MKNVMKMLVMVLLFSACSLASSAPQNSRPIHLAVIVDASPTSEDKWGQIKLFTGRTLHALESGDRLEIYSARKDSVVLHISSTVKQTSDAVVLRCLDNVGKIFFLDRADIAKSAEFVFETFKTNSQDFDCCLLIVSDGQMPGSQIRQLRRVLSAYKMRSWPVVFATFDDADKDVFRGGANNEFAVALIGNDGLRLWLDKIRTQSLQKLTSESRSISQRPTDQPIIVLPNPQQPITKQPEIKKKDTAAQLPVKPAAKAPVGQEVKTIEKKDNIQTEPKPLNTDTVTDIELKNQQTLTAKIKSVKTPPVVTAVSDSNIVKTSAVDVNNIKISSNKLDVNKTDINNVGVQKVAKAAVQSAKTTSDANRPEHKPPSWPAKMRLKKKIMFIPALLITAFIVYYIYQKAKAGRSGKSLLTDDQQESSNLKLMAAYNGTEYELGDINTIANLEIGSHPGSTIPIEADGADERLFAIKVKKGSFHIKNLSGQILTVSSVPLVSNEKCRLILPADIRYGDKVSIQLYQLSQDDINSHQPQLQKEENEHEKSEK